MIYGLTSISEQLKRQKQNEIFFSHNDSKGLTIWLSKKDGRLEAISELSKRIVHNTRVTRYILRHCAFNDIKHYRLSSAIFPLLTDKSLGISFSDLPNSAIIRNELKLVDLIAKKYNISIGSHPDQFNVLASTDREKVDRTINRVKLSSKRS